MLNRRFGVPLIDLGTVRLPRLVGHGRAMDLLLTGRPVGAAEALAMGLVNRVVPDGTALTAAVALARELTALPQAGLRNDRLSAIEQWDLTEPEAVANELRRGMATLASGETAAGAASFAAGQGRHGAALPPNPDLKLRSFPVRTDLSAPVRGCYGPALSVGCSYFEGDAVTRRLVLVLYSSPPCPPAWWRPPPPTSRRRWASRSGCRCPPSRSAPAPCTRWTPTGRGPTTTPCCAGASRPWPPSGP